MGDNQAQQLVPPLALGNKCWGSIGYATCRILGAPKGSSHDMGVPFVWIDPSHCSPFGSI